MLIRNVYNYTHLNGYGKIKDIYLTADGQFGIAPQAMRLDAQELVAEQAESYLVALPGLLDTHLHGYGGADFSQTGDHPEQIARITTALGETGLSYVMATLISLSLPVLAQCLRALDAYVQMQNKSPQPGVTQIVGVHLEGPFIAKNCRGAHAEEALLSSIDLSLFRKIIANAPHITQWKITLDPDLPGAETFIKEVKTLEREHIFVQVALGHANPDKASIDRAIAAGAVGFTHLGNACLETCCREARQLASTDAHSHLVQWVLENKDVCPSGVELIVDGAHLSQSFVQLVRKTIGNKITLVSDALGPSGLADGVYPFGSLCIRKQGQQFYLADQAGDFVRKEKTKNKILAGSAATLPFCVAQYVDWIKPLIRTREENLMALYTSLISNPRRSSLAKEAIAKLPDEKNMVILDERGRLRLSVCGGLAKLF